MTDARVLLIVHLDNEEGRPVEWSFEVTMIVEKLCKLSVKSNPV